MKIISRSRKKSDPQANFFHFLHLLSASILKKVVAHKLQQCKGLYLSSLFLFFFLYTCRSLAGRGAWWRNTPAKKVKEVKEAPTGSTGARDENALTIPSGQPIPSYGHRKMGPEHSSKRSLRLAVPLQSTM